MSVYDDVDEDYCAELGLDAAKVLSAVRRLNKAARELEAMGLTIYGGAGAGTVRDMGHNPAKHIAELDGRFDGGDGGREHWD